uniref:Putative PR domain zinc finger protein 2 n=1 Tax=Davidia involucrata TaxID=16924 RepID=A0A5B7C2F5_DAVIN
MASIWLSTIPLSSSISKSISMPSTSSSYESPSSSSSATCCRFSLVITPLFVPRRTVMISNYNSNRRAQRHVVRMAPDEEKLTRRNPLDFPIEWERPKPGRRPDIFPQFSPMKTPLPPPLPCDPPEEDEEEEEKKDEEEEDPEKDEPDKPENQ